MDPITRAIHRAAKATVKKLGSNVEVPVFSYNDPNSSDDLLRVPLPENPWIDSLKFRLIYTSTSNGTEINTRRWGEVLARLLIIFRDKPKIVQEQVERVNERIRNHGLDRGVWLGPVQHHSWQHVDPRLFSDELVGNDYDLLNHLLRSRVEIETTGDSFRPVRRTINFHGNDDNSISNGLRDIVREHRRLHRMKKCGGTLTVEPIVNRLLKTMDRNHRDRLVSHLVQNPIASLCTRAYEPTWNQWQLNRAGHAVPLMLESVRFKEGLLMGRVRISSTITWNNKRLSLSKMDIPESLVEALIGERLGKLIDHQALDPDAIIERIQFQKNERIVVHTDGRDEPLDLPSTLIME